MFKQWIKAFAVVVTLGGSVAHAQNTPNAPWESQSRFRLAAQLGLTTGGDTLASATFSNGDTETLKAGGLINLAAGVIWEPAQIPFAAQLMVGYHFDTIDASNGDMRFERYPIELLGLYTGAGKLRLGAGLRYVTSPRLKVNVGGVANGRVDFDDTVGFIAEVGYQFSRQFWLSLRGTFEDYKASSVNGASVVSTGTISGNSVGLYAGVAF